MKRKPAEDQKKKVENLIKKTRQCEFFNVMEFFSILLNENIIYSYYTEKKMKKMKAKNK